MSSPANNNNTPNPSYPRRGQPPRRRFAGLLAALRSSFVETPTGFEIEIEPMDASTAFGATWTSMLPSSARTLVVGSTASGRPIGDAADAAEIPIIERYGSASIVIDDDAVTDLAPLLKGGDLTAVRVDGPIETADVRAIIGALSRGQSAVNAEIRAVAALSMRGAHGLAVETRKANHAITFLAEAMRRYLAEMTGQPVDECTVPDAGVLERVLDRSGSFAVRPIETEIYSTAVDVGIVTCPTGRQPADTSLIYDLYSKTWHSD